jgi:hypothetical protein
MVPSSAETSAPKVTKSPEYFEYLAWESVLAAENAIWFKHFQEAFQKDAWYDEAFRTHLGNVYVALQKAGRKVEPRKFLPVNAPRSRKPLANLDSALLKFDGRFDENEWYEKAGIIVVESSPERSGKQIPVRLCYYGMDDNNLFLALDGGASSLERLLQDQKYHIRVVLTYENNRTTVIDLSDDVMKKRGVLVAVRENIAEIRIPFHVIDNFDTGSGIINAVFSQDKTYDPSMGMAIQIEAGLEPDFGKWPSEGNMVLIENLSGLIDVVFEVDTDEVRIPRAIYITGDVPALGNWNPNVIRLFDNGTHGDRISNDKIWSRSIKLKIGQKVQYRFSNSGTPGKADGQEFEKNVRTLVVHPDAGTPERMVVSDNFGVLMR